MNNKIHTRVRGLTIGTLIAAFGIQFFGTYIATDWDKFYSIQKLSSPSYPAFAFLLEFPIDIISNLWQEIVILIIIFALLILFVEEDKGK